MSTTITQTDPLRHSLIQYLQCLQAAGVTQLPTVSGGPPIADPVTGQPQIAADARLMAQPGSAESIDPQQALTLLQQEVSACTRCSQLAESRTQTVFGVGNPKPRLCFLGEAPGADEDRKGEPFVGAAGQLLNRIIQACTLQRSEVYILNVLKCRPPQNRNPSQQEAHNCRPFLDRQLEILQPEFICCLGGVAATNLLGTDQPVGRLRGQLHDYQGIKVLVTYHPAYLLRQESAKRLVWQDMQLLMKQMGISIPGR